MADLKAVAALTDAERAKLRAERCGQLLWRLHGNCMATVWPLCGPHVSTCACMLACALSAGHAHGACSIAPNLRASAVVYPRPHDSLRLRLCTNWLNCPSALPLQVQRPV